MAASPKKSPLISKDVRHLMSISPELKSCEILSNVRLAPGKSSSLSLGWRFSVFLVAAAPDNSVFLAGFQSSFDGQGYDITMVKIDADGYFLWDWQVRYFSLGSALWYSKHDAYRVRTNMMLIES